MTYLMVATGVEVRYDLIEGMSTDLIGQNGIACAYDNPIHGAATARAVDELVEKGGKALMTRPITAIKCAGAPLKVTLLTEHRMREAGTRNRTEMHYLSGKLACSRSRTSINSFTTICPQGAFRFAIGTN